MWTDALQTRHLFFTGKGGVGKTSLACATAMALANAGRRVLIVSTDPASNLDEVFGTALQATPVAIHGVPNLWGANLDPEEAARGYRERAVAPYRGILPDAAIRSIEEQFSGACTVEIAAFDEFSKLLGNPETTATFDHIVFDTAPTGHTLRLLSLPAAWSGFIAGNEGGSSCLGPLSALQAQVALYRSALKVLQDPESTTVLLVTRPEVVSLREADRARGELQALGIRNLRLLVNGVFQPEKTDDPVAQGMAARARAALDQTPSGLRSLQATSVPLFPRTMVGLDALRLLLGKEPAAPAPVAHKPELPRLITLAELAVELGRAPSGVVMTMGKGGVGKTSLAAAVAQALVQQGHEVVLTTTDPAAHVQDAVEEAHRRLSVTRIDPEVEVAAYRAEVLERAGAGLDPQGLALLEEDLRSPCTEEIAVFRAFARAVDEGESRWVVMDTAPTGHTLLLLDATQAYQREVGRTQGEVPESVAKLLPRLRDPEFCRVLIVTLPEPTPVHEARRLQDDLLRAGIRPYAWVVNQSLLLAGTSDPVLRTKAGFEAELFREVEGLASRTVGIPWNPRGVSSAPL